MICVILTLDTEGCFYFTKYFKKGGNMAKTKNSKKEKESKKGLWARFMTYCRGVKTEFKRVHWTTKSDLLRYSVATLVFVVVFSLFFYGVNALYSLMHSILG